MNEIKILSSSKNNFANDKSTLNSLCPKCGSQLKIIKIYLDKSMIICSNKSVKIICNIQCLFPLDQDNLIEYYCDNHNIYHFIKNFPFKKEIEIKNINDNLLSFDINDFDLFFDNNSVDSNINIRNINFSNDGND